MNGQVAPMPVFNVLSPAEQVSAHLKEELLQGRWKETMPGAPQLAKELRLNPKTVDAALRLLEARGMLASRGAGRPRRIELPPEEDLVRPLRVEILLSDITGQKVDYVGELRHNLAEAGHNAYFSQKSLNDLGMEVSRIRKLVEGSAADAWVVMGGSRRVLEWFSKQRTPAFALFGRHKGLNIAAARPDKIPAYAAATDKLVSHGHRRIVLLARTMRRSPEPGTSEKAFLGQLESHGIPTGPYNLPDWEDNIHGFAELLKRLFRITPPTALIIQEAFLFSAAHHFLTKKGLRIPEDVSLICTDADRSFEWCLPQISHMQWDNRPLIRRIVNWAEGIGNGKADLRQTLTKAEFVEGGTIGPAKLG